MASFTRYISCFRALWKFKNVGHSKSEYVKAEVYENEHPK